MANQVKIRHDTDADIQANTPALDELVANETTKRLHLGDGATQGGIAHARLSDLQVLAPVAEDFAGADNLTITLDPAPSAYVDKMLVIGRAAAANTGAMTCNPNGLGAKSIKKFGSLEMEANDVQPDMMLVLIFDSANDVFHIIGGLRSRGAWDLISSQVVGTTVGAVEFTAGLTSQFESYMFDIAQLTPTAAGDLYLRASIDGGSTWLAGTTYRYHANDPSEASGAYAGYASAGNDRARISLTPGAGATDHVSGKLFLYAPADTVRLKLMHWHFAHLNGSVLDGNWGSGMINTASAVDGIQFAFTGTNLDGGRISLYGLRNN